MRAARRLDVLAVYADGTYKIHAGGWTVGVLGCHSVYYNKNTKSASQCFRPFGYSFMKSESTLGYEKFFSSMRDLCATVFGEPLVVHVACSDRCEALCNAFQNVWPGVSFATCHAIVPVILTCSMHQVSFVTCYPHVMRKCVEARSRLVDGEYFSTIDQHVRLLHSCCSQQQFDALSGASHCLHVLLVLYAEYFMHCSYCVACLAPSGRVCLC